MTHGAIAAVVAILALWAAGAYAVWRWGPGVRRRTVWCPVYKLHARIVAEQKEAAFKNSYAGLEVLDVTHCSLFKGGPLECKKECLQYL